MWQAPKVKPYKAIVFYPTKEEVAHHNESRQPLIKTQDVETENGIEIAKVTITNLEVPDGYFSRKKRKT